MATPNTLQGIKTLIRGFINRTDLSEDLLESAINVALQKAQRKLRVPFMEISGTVTLAAGDNVTPIPGNYLELKSMYANKKPLERKSLGYLYSLQETTGTPIYFAREGGSWLLYPTPDGPVELKSIFYGELEPLEEPEDTNVLLAISSDMVLWWALSFLGEWFEDARSDKWEAKAIGIALELQEQADTQEYSGSTLFINNTSDY